MSPGACPRARWSSHIVCKARVPLHGRDLRIHQTAPPVAVLIRFALHFSFSKAPPRWPLKARPVPYAPQSRGPPRSPSRAGWPGMPDAWHDLCPSSPGTLPFRTIAARGVTHDTGAHTDVGTVTLAYLPGSGARRQTVHAPHLSPPSPRHCRGGRAPAENPAAVPRRRVPVYKLSPAQASRWSWRNCER